MKCDGFTPTEPVRLRHRLALADLRIRWDSDPGDDADTDDVILGILSVLHQFVNDQINNAAYDFSCSLRIIGDAHPRLRPVCYPLARRARRIVCESCGHPIEETPDSEEHPPGYWICDVCSGHR